MINTQRESVTINFRPDITATGLSNEQLALLHAGEGHEMGLEPVTLEELEHTYLYDGLVQSKLLLSAVTSMTSRLPKTMAAFMRQLNKKLNGTGIKAGVKTEFYDNGGSSQELAGVLISKPRSLGLFSVITAQIPCSDGQSVSVVFHAPDDDPKKITPDDKLIAFRFLLNKRDITHIVAPSNGKDISLDQTVMSLSNALEKNSKKFQDNIQKSMADRKELADKQEKFERLTDELAQVNSQIESIDSVNSTLTQRQKELEESLNNKERKADLTRAKITDFTPVEEPTEEELLEQRRQKLRDFIGRGRAPKGWELDLSSIDDVNFIAALVITPIDKLVDQPDTTYMLAIDAQLDIAVTYSEASPVDGGESPADWAAAKAIMVKDFTETVLPSVGVNDLIDDGDLGALNAVREEYGLPPLPENQREDEVDTLEQLTDKIKSVVELNLPALITLVEEATANGERVNAPGDFKSQLVLLYNQVESNFPDAINDDVVQGAYMASQAAFADTMLVELQNAGMAPVGSEKTKPIQELIDSIQPQVKSLGGLMRERYFSYGGISELVPEYKDEMLALVDTLQTKAPEESQGHPFVNALKLAASKTYLTESYAALMDTWLAGEEDMPEITTSEKKLAALLEDTQEMVFEWIKAAKKELRSKGISAKVPENIRNQVAAQASVLMNAMSEAGIAENAKVDALLGAYNADPFIDGLKDAGWEVMREKSDDQINAQLEALQKIIDGQFEIDPAVDTVNQANDVFDEFELYETHPELYQANNAIADAMRARLDKYEEDNK